MLYRFTKFLRLLLVIFILNFNCIFVKSIVDLQNQTSPTSLLGLFLGLFSNNQNTPVGENWSAPSTWGEEGIPTQGQDVIIPSNKHIILDISPPNLGNIQIDGTLEFARKDISLTAKNIMVHGTLQIGTEGNLFAQKAIITLNDTDTSASFMGMGTRGISVMGGKLELHGLAPSITRTQISNHIAQGNTSLTLKESVNWKVGDEIVLGPTDYYHIANGFPTSQKVSIVNISGNSITFNTPSNYQRWGRLQYITNSGLSLSSNNLISSPTPDTSTQTTPKILDERAPVGRLTRNILIQSEDDDVWQNQGFGVHIMIMGENATAHVEGVEIKRAGQRGRLRRYPFHWHMLSYNGTQTRSDATGQYFRNSSIHNSKNRGLVIHGTNGVLAQNNVIFDIEGHGVFLENAVERRNRIDGNLVLLVRNSPNPLKVHESGERGSSCFWLSNPDNTVINNTAADCANNGYWLAFPTRPFGESANVLAEDGLLLNPARLRFGTFDNNTAHSNRFEGIMLDNPEIDEDGNVSPHQYHSTTDGRNISWPFTTLRRFSLSRYKVWKNGSNGIWDRAIFPDNYEVVSADNCGRFFAGSGADGVIERSLVIGTSLNHLMNGIDRLAQADFAGGHSSSTPVAFATYHSTFDIKNNIIVNFPAVTNNRSGAFSTDDYYTRPVEKGTVRNTGNILINSHPGVKLQAPFNYFTLASALHDPFGIWGPSGNYFVYDVPFLTYGKTIHSVSPGTSISGGVSVSGPFYGFEGFVLHGVGDTPPQNQPYFDLMAIHVIRWNSDRTTQIDVWNVPAANAYDLLQHMRDFATSPDSVYELTFPGENHPTNFQVNVENMLNSTDLQTIGIQFDGNLNPVVGMLSYSNWYPYQSVNSYEEVLNSSGETFWQDKPNNRVWVKLRGGRWAYYTNDPNESVPTSDDLLYETTQLRIIGN